MIVYQPVKLSRQRYFQKKWLILSYSNGALFEKILWEMSRVFWNRIIVKTIWSWKPFFCEYTYRLISTINILHWNFSLLTLSVHSHLLCILTCLVLTIDIGAPPQVPTVYAMLICLEASTAYRLSGQHMPALKAGTGYWTLQ